MQFLKLTQIKMIPHFPVFLAKLSSWFWWSDSLLYEVLILLSAAPFILLIHLLVHHYGSFLIVGCRNLASVFFKKTKSYGEGERWVLNSRRLGHRAIYTDETVLDVLEGTTSPLLIHVDNVAG